MKRIGVITSIFCLSALFLTGCADKKTSETEVKINTPRGETTITTEREVKESGEDPPSANP